MGSRFKESQFLSIRKGFFLVGSWAGLKLVESKNMNPRFLQFGFGLVLTWICSAADFTPAPQQFQQEIAGHKISTGTESQAPVQLMDAGPGQTLRMFSGGRWFTHQSGDWKEEPALAQKSREEFTFAGPDGNPQTVRLAWSGVKQIIRRGSEIWLATELDPMLVVDGKINGVGWPSKWKVNQIALGAGDELVVASSDGLFRRAQGGWQAIGILDPVGRAWAVKDVLAVTFDSNGQLWFGTRAGVGCKTSQGWRVFEGRDGLPWNDFTAAAAGPNGEVWFATHLGVIRWDGRDFHYRQGKRWLPHDDVRSVVVDGAGRAWFATAAGPGLIERKPMTLAAKAEFYEEEIERYIKRTPFGYTAEAWLRKPADKSSADPHDSDNDGLWTSMYGAGQCFAYAATKNPRSHERATKAFEALRFLQKVTQGGKPSPDKGYVARTIRSVELPDPNIGRLESDLKEQKEDKLWKAYEPRWPKSADGKWYWKSDTSSDELDGHYFFYPLYHDLVASTPAEKDRVREVVRDLTDHLIQHGFTLTDVDGKPTRWAIYGPQSLNRDPNWWAERGLNSLSILSYLATAAHVTGDSKYKAVARELIEKHGYAQNMMYPKVHFGPGSGNQSDDEMAVMCFYNLLRYGSDLGIANQVRYAFYAYWANEAPELNPFFHFAFAAHGLGQKVPNVWGEFSVSPWAGWHEDSMATLHGFPLDRLNWGHKNSHRLDLVLLARQKSPDLYAPRPGRGHRVGGKVLPVENRHFEHWNTDPWHLNYSGDGQMLGSGAVFLLPYYMGLYHGYIQTP